MVSNARQKMEHVFEIDYYSEQDDCTYKGTFTSKKLSIIEKGKVNIRKIELNGGRYYDPDTPGIGIDEFTDHMNYMIAYLEFSLVKYPDWWDMSTLGDLAVVGTVWKEVMEHHSRFLGRTENSSGANTGGPSQGSSQETAQASDRSGVAREVVGEEVSAALKP